jgi:hypothetical protein
MINVRHVYHNNIIMICVPLVRVLPATRYIICDAFRYYCFIYIQRQACMHLVFVIFCMAVAAAAYGASIYVARDKISEITHVLFHADGYIIVVGVDAT